MEALIEKHGLKAGNLKAFYALIGTDRTSFDLPGVDDGKQPMRLADRYNQHMDEGRGRGPEHSDRYSDWPDRGGHRDWRNPPEPRRRHRDYWD